MVSKSIIVDSNIILDVLLEQEPWFSWSASKISEHYQNGRLLINKIIFAEVSSGFSVIEDVDAALKNFSRIDLSYEMAFLAAKIFKKYRKKSKNKEERQAILPDFFIGAQALILNLPLLTRDKRFKAYFPELQLITP